MLFFFVTVFNGDTLECLRTDCLPSGWAESRCCVASTGLARARVTGVRVYTKSMSLTSNCIVKILSFCWFRLCVAVSQSAFLVSTTQWCDFLIIVDIIHWETLTQEKLISSIFCSLYNLITRVSLVTKTDFYHIRRPWNPDGELCMRSLRILVVSSSIFFFSLSTKITN